LIASGLEIVHKQIEYLAASCSIVSMLTSHFVSISNVSN
jgi:hypothetical protein